MKSQQLYKLFNISYGVLLISSLMLWFYKVFKTIETPYGVRPHSLTSSLTHLHVILVPLITIILGVFLLDHSFKQLKKRKKLYSGLAMVTFTLLMIVTGYIGQIMIDRSAREQILNLHIWVSVLWSATYFVHKFFQK